MHKNITTATTAFASECIFQNLLSQNSSWKIFLPLNKDFLSTSLAYLEEKAGKPYCLEIVEILGYSPTENIIKIITQVPYYLISVFYS